MNPSPEMLEVFAAAIRQLDDQNLFALRDRFVQAEEHPAAIHALNVEMERRDLGDE